MAAPMARSPAPIIVKGARAKAQAAGECRHGRAGTDRGQHTEADQHGAETRRARNSETGHGNTKPDDATRDHRKWE
jgi:hypothetical protein